MKIYIIGPAYPYRGGISDSGMRLATELQAFGHQVQLINFTKQYPDFLFPGKTQYATGQAPTGLTIRRMIHSFNPFNWLRVGWKLKKEKPDLIIVRFWLPFMAMALGTICKITSWNKHTQIIAIPDNIKPHEKRLGDGVLTKYFVGSVHKFITLSAGVQQDLKSFTDKPSIVLAHPIYDIFGSKIDKKEARKQLGLLESDEVMLFFGLIRDYKGLDVLLQAMTDYRIKTRGTKLIIAGEYYSGQEEYEKFIKENNLSEQLLLATHFIPTEKVSLYFSAADVVVQPYKTATQSGITQIAIHFEKPMIVTRVGGLPEVVTDEKTGYVVSVDAAELADTILRFFEHNKMAEFEKEVKLQQKKYQWNYFTEKLLELAQS